MKHSKNFLEQSKTLKPLEELPKTNPYTSLFISVLETNMMKKTLTIDGIATRGFNAVVGFPLQRGRCLGLGVLPAVVDPIISLGPLQPVPPCA